MAEQNPQTVLTSGASGYTYLDRSATMTATTTVDPPVAAPPADIEPFGIRRVSVVWDPPGTLTAMGRPVDWTAGTTTIEDLGTFRFRVNSADVTYFRGAETKLTDVATTDPYGDATATLVFAQISPLEELGVGDLDWLAGKHHRIRVGIILAAGVSVTDQFGQTYSAGDELPYFNGVCKSRVSATDERPATLSLECEGTLYRLDTFIKPPFLDVTPARMGAQIVRAINDRAVNEGWPGGSPQDLLGDAAPMTSARGSWSKLASDYINSMLQVGTMEDGTQVTVSQKGWGTPVVRTRGDGARTWTVRCWQDGVTHDLTDDDDEENAAYGSGIRADGCRWANLFLTGLSPVDAPAYPYDPSTVFVAGGGLTGFGPFADKLRSRGYDMVSGDTYDTADVDEVERFQAFAGIQVDGVVGPQTWHAAFDTGEMAGDYSGLYLPLYADPRVERWAYNADGDVTGSNPAWAPDELDRVEGFRDYGQPVGKHSAVKDARWRVRRNVALGVYGTVTLTGDPQEGWRGLIRAGDKLVMEGFQGRTVTLHVSACQIRDPMSPRCQAALTVDEKSRDLLSLAERLNARRAAKLPPIVRKPNPNSRIVVDSRIIFECENDAGHIGPVAQFAGLGNVFAIPAAERGTFVGVHAHTEDVPTTFIIALFAKPVTDTQIRSGIFEGNDPTQWMDVSGTQQSPWDVYYDSLIDAGWIDTWGGPDDLGGYSPYPATDNQGNPSPVTGRLIDDGTVDYYSDSNGHLWAWVLTTDSTVITIDLLAAPDDGSV